MKADNTIDPSRSTKPVMYINIVRGTEMYHVKDSVHANAMIKFGDDLALGMEIEWRRGRHEMAGFRVIVNHFAK